jgi:excisionase family DNA binding protein
MEAKAVTKPSKRKGKRLSKTQKEARAAARQAKRQDAAMVGPEALAAVLGVGLNQAYDVLIEKRVPALRVGRRWLIARVTLDRLANGEITLTPAAA